MTFWAFAFAEQSGLRVATTLDSAFAWSPTIKAARPIRRSHTSGVVKNVANRLETSARRARLTKGHKIRLWVGYLVAYLAAFEIGAGTAVASYNLPLVDSGSVSSRKVDSVSTQQPIYSNPPVTETSLGVRFAPIQGWNIGHYGLFYHLVRDQYPRFEAVPPIMPAGPVGFNVTVTPVPKIRALFANPTRTRLLQIQDDLFFANWQKMPNEEQYPRYTSLQADFLDRWDDFQKFLSDNKLYVGALTSHQLTYINVLEPDLGPDLLEVHDVCNSWSPSPNPLETATLNLSLNATYSFAGVELSYQLQPAVRVADGKNVLQFTLAASTPPSIITAMSREQIRFRIDKLHEVIVMAFQTLTTERAKRAWGKRVEA